MKLGGVPRLLLPLIVGRGLVTVAVLTMVTAVGSIPALGASPAPRNVVLVNARTGAIDRSFPDVDPIPESVVSDGRGGWFVPAQSVGSVAVDGIAHLRSDGTLDRSWKAELPSGARAAFLARIGNRLYTGVYLGTGTNDVTTGVDAIDATTGRRLWTAPSFTTDPEIAAAGYGVAVPIWALTASREAVYVAGLFAHVGSANTIGESVIALDPRDGHLLPWRMKDPTLQPNYHYDIEALAVAGPRLYVGGSIGIQAISTRTGSLVPWAPRFQGDEVTAIAVVGPTVFVGGIFDFEAYDAVTAEPKSWTAGLGGDAGAFAVSGSTVYLGGNLRSGFGTAFHFGYASTNNLAAVDVATGRFEAWTPNLARYVSVSALAVSGGKVLVSGNFQPLSGDLRLSLDPPFDTVMAA